MVIDNDINFMYPVQIKAIEIDKANTMTLTNKQIVEISMKPGITAFELSKEYNVSLLVANNALEFIASKVKKTVPTEVKRRKRHRYDNPERKLPKRGRFKKAERNPYKETKERPMPETALRDAFKKAGL